MPERNPAPTDEMKQLGAWQMARGLIISVGDMYMEPG